LHLSLSSFSSFSLASVASALAVDLRRFGRTLLPHLLYSACSLGGFSPRAVNDASPLALDHADGSNLLLGGATDELRD
jgi:hypothetical protein